MTVLQEWRDRRNVRAAHLLRAIEIFSGTGGLCPVCRHAPEPPPKLKGARLDAWRRDNVHHYQCELDIMIRSFEHRSEGW
ncbi:MAG TPA: hypothetical protein VFA98_06240 [Thermoanaerobaculia bacterium]|nr:hypothetical protein [Thermoanaerobaculia bacterium]